MDYRTTRPLTTRRVLWSCGPVGLWSCGPVVPWSCGPVVLWSSGPVVQWSCGSGLLGAEHFGDLDPQTIFHDDHFSLGDLLLVDIKVHRGVGDLVQLDDRAGVKLEDLAHGHLAGTEFDGQLDRHIEQNFEIGWRVHSRYSMTKVRRQFSR